MNRFLLAPSDRRFILWGVFLSLCVFAILTAGIGLASARAAAPSCAAGPALRNDGTKVVGTECNDRIIVTSEEVETVLGGGGDDVIFVNNEVAMIDGGDGDDHLYGEPPTPETNLQKIFEQTKPIPPTGPVYRVGSDPGTSEGKEPAKSGVATFSVTLGDGSQTFHGGPGNDWIFGQRGNDTLYGHNNEDLLYGGPGDDQLEGEQGDDILGGGFGTDIVDGGDGSDMVRGDATTDNLQDNGSYGVDTLSFSTATAPGFSGSTSYANFPPEGAERGVYVRLDGIPACTAGENSYPACNNVAKYGGGYDQVVAWQFENVIGSPFADLIVGNAWDNRIDGGGGTDAIYGSAGNDVLYGGADGDFIQGDAGTDVGDGQGGVNSCWSDVETKVNCSEEGLVVHPRDPSKISVGFEATNMPSYTHSVQLYVVGSTSHDSIYGYEWIDSETGKVYVTFVTQPDTWAYFDTSGDAYTSGCNYIKEMVNCYMPATVDSIVMAGMSQDDQVNIYQGGFYESVSPVLLGGSGNDAILGSGSTEDVLIDGEGADWLTAFGWDDVLVNDVGNDTLEGGNGNDLLLSTEVCGGDILHGARFAEDDAAGQNSVSWAQLPAPLRAVASLESGYAGNSYSGGPTCTFGSLSTMYAIDDLEGSSQNDILYGDVHPNGILGRLGNDSLYGRNGADFMQAGSNGNPEGQDLVHGDGGPTDVDVCETDSSDTVTTCNP